MHCKINERFEAIVQRTFGPTAALTGSMGTPDEPGDVQIILDGRPIGTGPTFEAALQQAQTAAALSEISGAGANSQRSPRSESKAK